MVQLHRGLYDVAFSYHVDTASDPHRDDCIRPPKEGNSWYPLPPRYEELHPEEQRWWRVNACCIQQTPEDVVTAYAFFLYQYLWPKESCFLQTRRHSPPFHYQLVHDIATYPLNVIAAPRYSCKTTLVQILTLLLVCTRRNYKIGILCSKQEKSRKGLGTIRKQLEENQLLHADFVGLGVPASKGRRRRSTDIMELPAPYNGEITGMSLDGRERGWHGQLLFIDDAEKDPNSEEVIPEYVEKLDARLRFVYVPMVDIGVEDLDNPEVGQLGCGIAMLGTIIGENMVLNRIATAEPGGPYDSWNKRKLQQDLGNGLYLWPQRWGPRATEAQRGFMGDDAFDSEKLGRPGLSQTGSFRIDPVNHTYNVDVIDDFQNNPLRSDSIVRWGVPTQKGTEWRSLKVCDWLGNMTIGIFVDPADTENVNQSSDYTAIHVVGNDAGYSIWSLDLSVGRYNTTQVIDELIRLTVKWWPRFFALEACSIYDRIVDEIYLGSRDHLVNIMGWVPFPKKLGPFNRKFENKGSRIDRIRWRFISYRIRFPVWLQGVWPYSACWHQVNNFTPNLKKLKYDDIVDTLGLTPYMFSGPGGRPVSENPWEGKSVVELIESGIIFTPDGRPLTDFLPSYSHLTPKAAHVLEVFNGRQTVNRALPRPVRALPIAL